MPDSHSNDIIALATTTVREAEERARRAYRIDLPHAELDFSLRGRCAGQARVAANGQTSIRLNRSLLQDNLDDFLAQTIPHEVAHLVVNWQARRHRQRPRPHGVEWQSVMRDCFGLSPERCHSYRTTAARVVPRNYLYRCECRDHHLTRIMHNKIQRRARALCKTCMSPLTFLVKEDLAT